MSEALATSTKPETRRNDASDLQMLAQVEKWMAMIRELNREQQGETKLRA
jgi:hypothetical protein